LTGTFEKPSCQPFDHPQYWGHYLGHYLNAAAIFIQNQGASAQGKAMQAKIADLLNILSGVQAAWTAAGEPGFLYPYSPLSFDTLEQGRNCDPVCVP
jgi:hypothetical protein